MQIEVTDRQHSTILAALRFWQLYQEGDVFPEASWATTDRMTNIHEIAGFAGEQLCADEVDTLCEEINCAE